MSDRATAGGWALRAHAACDWLFWVMTVNALWYVFTLAGGVVLGAAPATVAATELTRRRLRGEVFPAVRAFAAAWRREFWRANAVLAPLYAAQVILAVNAVGFLRAGMLAQAPGVVTVVAFVLVFAVAAVAVPLYAHYELPLARYVLTASRWMLRNLAHVVLLLLAATVVVTASLLLPGLIPLVSTGAWLVISTTLCVAFFTANDKQLATTTPVAAGVH